jgi:dsRNA-specific ribonuclease
MVKFMTVKELYDESIKMNQDVITAAVEFLVKDKQILKLSDSVERFNELLDQQTDEELAAHKRFERVKEKAHMQMSLQSIIGHFKGDVMITQLRNSFPDATKEEISRAIYEWLKEQERKGA